MSSVSPAVCWTSTKHQHHEGMCRSPGLILQPWTTSSSSSEARGARQENTDSIPHISSAVVCCFTRLSLKSESEPEPSCSLRSRSVWSHNKVQLSHFGLDGLCSDPDQTSGDKLHSLVSWARLEFKISDRDDQLTHTHTRVCIDQILLILWYFVCQKITVSCLVSGFFRGLLGPSGGPVRVHKQKGQINYVSSYAHGIQSQALARWTASFSLSSRWSRFCH